MYPILQQNCVFLHIFVFSDIQKIKLDQVFALEFNTYLIVGANTLIIFHFIHHITADFVFVVPWKVKRFLLHPKTSTPSKQHAIPFWEVSEESSRDCEESQGECGMLRETGNIWQQEKWKGKQQRTCINTMLIFVCVWCSTAMCTVMFVYIYIYIITHKHTQKWSEFLLEMLHQCMPGQ